MMSLLFSLGATQDQQTIYENQIYNGNVLNDKSFGFYSLTITQAIFTGAQSLSVKVIPEEFDSDPDVFISKINQYPDTPEESQWYCVRYGSDSCIISNNDINVGDIFYIGIRCINPCQFTLATNFLTVQSVSSANRTQFRFDGYSSNVISYFIPPTNRDGNTRALTFTVESDDLYNSIEVFFSLDSNIYQVEDRQIQNVFSNGVGFYFTENDFGWCTSCYVYFLVDVIVSSRYYITAAPSTRNPILQTSVPVNAIVNARQQECFQYFVKGVDNDLVVYSNSNQGETDLYISNGAVPTNITDSRVRSIAIKTSQKALIYSAEDRNRTNLRTGLVQICIYGYDDSSTLITPLEDNFNGRIDARSGVMYTFNIERNNTMYFRYTNADFNQNGNLTIQLTSYNLSNNQNPPRLFYKICPSDNYAACYLEVSEQRGGASMREIGFGAGNITNGNTRIVKLRHFPSNCSNVNSCVYLISAFFADSNGPMKSTFQVDYNTFNPADMSLDQEYRNIITQGQYFYYELIPGSTYGYQFLQSLTIKVQSIMGDADLVVSVTQRQPTFNSGQYESNQRDMYEAVTLNNTGNFTLNRPIYIGIYAYTSVAYYITFEPVYELAYNDKLVPAVPVYEAISNYNYFVSEYEESFYSFTPWWAGFEKRTIIFFADVIFNDVFFYMKANDYPMFYMTEYQDQNDIILLDPESPDYSIHNTYYIRARPSFGLYDLISMQQYIFNFYAFSQHSTMKSEDINLNEKKLGFANGTAAYYRHYILDNNGTYNFTVIPIIGDPALLIKMSNDQVYPTSDDVQSWDYKSDKFNMTPESILITFTDRSSKYAFCDKAGYNLNGGNKSCGFYIAIECQGACIFNITVQILGRENQNLPFYLTEDNYYTGKVNYGEYKYFYYPISKTDTGEMVLILNKTGNLRKNGDTMLLATLINETASRKVENWTYPNLKTYSIASSNYRSNQPEIIEICSQVLFSRCSNSSCVLMIGVLGLTPNTTSSFRLIVQKQQNKLFDTKPIVGVIPEVGQYHYYWFTSNVSAINPTTYWKYIISSSVDWQGQDVDLFLSVLDGRYPVSEDFDFSSTNYGPDNIVIDSNSRFFDDAGYNKSNGILFVVGVKALTPNAQYTLMMQGPNIQDVTLNTLTTGLQQTRGLNTNNKDNNTNYFKWYNWGQKDFRINIDVTQGAVSAYLNFVSEESYQANGHLALPRNSNNSKWEVQLNASQSGVLRVAKEETQGLFCYYCWYYITVTANSTGVISYRISVNEVPDVGEEVPILTVNQNATLTLPATGAVAQRKFILDATDSFSVTARVTTGLLVMYVGLYPNNAVTRFQWKAEGTGTVSIPIKQTDPNFRAGAFYYITVQAGSGRTSFILSVNQRRQIRNLQDSQIYKDQYSNLHERIKLYYFQAPTIKNQAFRAIINITSLTNDFYPVLLINKQNSTAQPSDFRNLNWPNMKTYNYTFGDNFFSIAGQKNVNIHLNYLIIQFSYVLKETGGAFTYFAIAMHSFSYGLTDQRKAQYKISVSIDTKNLNYFTQSLPAYYQITDSNPKQQQGFLQNNQKTIVFEKIQEWIQGSLIAEYWSQSDNQVLEVTQ